MKHFLFTLSLLFTITQSMNSQNSLSEYAYILVPQQFEFQSSRDQFQINTLTRHLFNSNGFNAIYDEELKELPRCSGLLVGLERQSSIFQTKITIVIKDCNNNILFQSDEGLSKEKEFRKAYHESIRRAFRSIEYLGVNQGDLNAFRESIKKRDAPFLVPQKTDLTPIPTSVAKIVTTNLPRYTHDGDTYFLEAKNDGYVLYKKQGEVIQIAGTLSTTSRPGMYLFNKDEKNMLANFDTDNNLMIDAQDSEGKLSQDVFTKVKQ